MKTARLIGFGLLGALALASISAASPSPVAVVSAAETPAATDPLAESYRLQAKNDLAGATRAARTAAEAAPKSYFPHLRLAYLQLLGGDYTASASNYRVAVALEPAAIEPLLGLQQALVALGSWDEAAKVGRDVLTRDPKSYLATSRLAWTLFKQKDYRGAGELYAGLVALYPGDVDMRVGLGDSLLADGKKGEACEAFRQVISMVPGHSVGTSRIAKECK